MSLDLEKLKFIDEKQVPRKKSLLSREWNVILSGIPKGKALVISFSVRCSASVRLAVARRQKRGQFSELKVFSRGEVTYIVNPFE